MTRFFFVLSALFALVLGFSAPSRAQTAKLEEAIFAGGCFWCMEHDMKAIPGVVSVESGYTGGHVKNPTYEDVTSETSGHYEAVRVRFDPARVSYAKLLERYWRLIDPTDDGGQFCDRGPSYRAAIFASAAQRPIAETSKADLIASKRVKGAIVTQILPAQKFYPAEPYHRDYAKNNSFRYNFYRSACGRDARLRAIWTRE